MEKQDALAAEVREFLTLNNLGMLSTLSKTEAGYPFGSIIPYDITDTGSLVIFVAQISEHYRNLRAAPQACVLVPDYYGIADPQAHGRASVMGDFLPIESEMELEQIKSSYWNRFPDAVDHSIAHTFVYLRCLPKRIRWIGGFGEIHWIDIKKYQSLATDGVAYAGIGILEHMNEDHRNAICDLIRFNLKKEVKEENARMVAINREGFTVAVREGGKDHRAVISFPRKLNSAGEVRETIIEMLKVARST